MNMRGIVRAAAGLIVLTLAVPLRAEITQITGRAEVEIQQAQPDSPIDREEAVELLPETMATFPLVVSSRILAALEPSAVSAAAQLADPAELLSPNPEEFALNLALISGDKGTTHTGRVLLEESRAIQFTAAELGGAAPDEVVELRGRFFIDGALTIFATQAGRDLTGATVKIAVTVIRRQAGSLDEPVFSGVVALEGNAEGGVTVMASGDIRPQDVVLSDLSVLPDQFGAFHLLVLPNLRINYGYSAVADQPFELVARITAEAANVDDGVGVAALLGSGADDLQAVLDYTQGRAITAKLLTAIEDERARMGGGPTPQLPLGACGLLGFEALLGLIALGGVRRMRRHRRKLS